MSIAWARPRSIAMALAQSRAEAGDKVRSFDLIDPILEGGLRFVRGDIRSGEHASRSQLFRRFRAITAERAIAQDREELEVLVQENGRRHTKPATDPDLLGEVLVLIAVEHSQRHFGGIGPLDVVEHGHLNGTVTTPQPRGHEHVDLPREGRDHCLVRWSKPHARARSFPVGLLIGRATRDIRTVVKALRVLEANKLGCEHAGS